jgi:hypothetical protein
LAFFLKVSMFLNIPYHVVYFLFWTRDYGKIVQNYTTWNGIPKVKWESEQLSYFPHKALNPVQRFVRKWLVQCERLAFVKKDFLSLPLSLRAIARCHFERRPSVLRVR